MSRRWAGLLLLGLLALPVGAAAPPADPPIPYPDLAPLEADVAEQIGAGRRRLEELLATAAPDPFALAAAYGELGKVFHAYGLTGPAEACYENASRLAPEEPRWAHYLGALLQGAGRLDEALQEFDRALRLSARYVPARVYQAEIYLLQGKTAEAEAALRQALDAGPAGGSTAAAKALLGQVALDRREFRQAVDLLEAALAEAPDANRLHYALGLAYRGLGDRVKSAEHLARAGQVGVRPRDPLLEELAALRSGERVRMARGKVAFDRGRYAEAAEEFRRALAARPESIEARINLAAALAQTGDPPGAVSLLREAVSLDPGNATARFNLGSLLAAAGSPEAPEHLAAAASARPGDGEAQRTLARALRDNGRLEEALRAYEKALEIDAADEAARLGEAETLVRLKRYGQARERLEEALRRMPTSGLLTHGLARLLAACPDLAVRDGARALELAQAVWQAAPLAAHAETVAMAYAELGRCPEAADWQKKAIAEAERTGQAARVPALAAEQSRYEKGAPCRPSSEP